MGEMLLGKLRDTCPHQKQKTTQNHSGTICGQYLDYAMPLLSLLFWTLGKILMLYQSVFRVKLGLKSLVDWEKIQRENSERS
nr:hypothetical protein Iba_chr15aCG8790 [Ipomoea batatas]